MPRASFALRCVCWAALLSIMPLAMNQAAAEPWRRFHHHQDEGYTPGYSISVTTGPLVVGSYEPGTASNDYPPRYYGYPQPYWLNTGAGPLAPYLLPPVVQSPDVLFGPQAVKRLMGVDPGFGQAPVQNRPMANGPQNNPPLNAGAPNPFPAPAANDPAIPVKLKLRVANAESRERAWKFIKQGDDLFGKQRFHEALQQYKKASESAPNLAEAYFRQGLTWVTMANYDQAAKMLRRGLSLQPTWPDSGFRLETLYQGNNLAQENHLEALAQRATDRPSEPDLYFLLGVELYFDGQVGRSEPFFRRAALLAAPEDYLRPFLSVFKPTDPRNAAPKAPPAQQPLPAPLPQPLPQPKAAQPGSDM